VSIVDEESPFHQQFGSERKAWLRLSTFGLHHLTSAPLLPPAAALAQFTRDVKFTVGGGL
jgi:hypothetical protein